MAGNPGRQLNPNSPRVGLVLAGGGVAGYGFHTGALAAVEATTGWDPRRADIIVGTSSGSIVAAVLRADVDTKELRERVLDTRPGAETTESLNAVVGPGSFRLPRIWRGPAAPALIAAELRRGRRLRPSNLVAGVLPEGRLSTAPLGAVVDTFHDKEWPTRPLWITATDLATGRRVVFGRDRLDVDLATAVEASCAIPGYFSPVRIGGQRFIDGGMRSPDNADLLGVTTGGHRGGDGGDEATHPGRELDLIVVLSPLSMAEAQVRQAPILSTLRAYPRRRLQANVTALRNDGTPVLVIEPDAEVIRTMGINAMSPNRLAAVVEAAQRSVERELGDAGPDDVRAVRLLQT